MGQHAHRKQTLHDLRGDELSEDGSTATLDPEGGMYAGERQHADSEVDRLRGECLTLQAQAENLRDERDTLHGELDILRMERDSLAKRVSEMTGSGSESLPFDPTQPYEVRKDFNAMVGPGQHVSYPFGTIVRDPYVLNLLKTHGAELRRA